MPLSDAQKTAMGYLGTIQAAIDKVDPIMKNTVVDFWGFGSSDAQNLKSNVANFTNGGTPFGFLVNIFQMLGSYDEMIEWLTNFLVKSLPALEITIKGVILSNLRNMLTCNIDPRIPEIYRKDGNVTYLQNNPGNGVYVNINSIDFAHILDVSPLTEEGSVYYFGTYEEGKAEPVKKDWKNYSAKEKFNFIKSGGKNKPDTLMTVKQKKFINVYRLARAYDFNAFLWFVIHKGKLPYPIYATVDSATTTSNAIINALSPDKDTDKAIVSKVEYNKKENRYEEDKELKFIGSAFKVGNCKPVLGGSTVTLKYKNNENDQTVMSKVVQMASMVDNITIDGTDGKEYTTTTAVFVPASDDCFSLNWYADPSNYYAYNLSLPKAKKPLLDYNKAKPICNVRYINQGKSADIAENHRILVSVPPKPFVTYTYNISELKDLYSFPFVNKILFDEDGNPSKSGHFSLRNGYTSTGKPYVMALEETLPDSVSSIWFNKFISGYEQGHNETFKNLVKNPDNPATSNYKFFISIGDYAKRILSSYAEKIDSMTNEKNFTKKFNVPESGNSDEFKAEYGTIDKTAYIKKAKKDILEADGDAEKYADICVLSKYTKEDLLNFHDILVDFNNDLIDILVEASQERTSADGADYFTFDRFKVGDTDDCMLYVNRFTGEYALGSSKLGNDKKLVMKEMYKAHLQECYAGLTVYEFNYDLIMGMNLFDAKVLATSLVSALFNLSVGVGASVRMPSIWGNEETSIIRSIITDVINASDETEITDCFFTFTNEKYEDLLSRAEKKYLETGTIDNGSLKNIKINTKPLMDILEEYDEHGTIQEQTDVISRFFKQASVSYTENEEDMTDTDKNHAKVKFATNLIGALAGVLIEAILTPKVMLAYQVNREMAGGDITDFHNFKEFLEGMKMLIVSMVREIRDIIMKELMDKAMQMINQLVSMFGIALLKEQLQVFKELFDKLLRDCVPNLAMLMSMFKRAPRTLVDTTLPVVEYADIISNISDAPVAIEGTEPIIDNC